MTQNELIDPVLETTASSAENAPALEKSLLSSFLGGWGGEVIMIKN